jgi:hypothetical protein
MLHQDLMKDVPSEAGYFTADGRCLATSLGKCWNVNDWSEGAVLPGGVLAAAPTPDRPLLAVLVHNAIGLVNPEPRQVLARLEDPHQHKPYSVTFGPNGTRLIVVTNEGRCVNVWDLREIRLQLAKLELDWDGPAYPPADGSENSTPLHVEVNVGFFADRDHFQKALMRTRFSVAPRGAL